MSRTRVQIFANCFFVLLCTVFYFFFFFFPHNTLSVMGWVKSVLVIAFFFGLAFSFPLVCLVKLAGIEFFDSSFFLFSSLLLFSITITVFISIISIIIISAPSLCLLDRSLISIWLH